MIKIQNFEKLIVTTAIAITLIAIINILAVAYIFITDYQGAIDALGGLF